MVILMCDQTKTPEGLLVCRDTGEVLGVDFEEDWPGSPSSTVVYPPGYIRAPTFVPSPSGKPRGFRKLKDKIMRRTLSGVELLLYRRLKRLMNIASYLGVNKKVTSKAIELLSALHSKGVRRMTECDLAAVLLIAHNLYGLNPPVSLVEFQQCGDPEKGVNPMSKLLARAIAISERLGVSLKVPSAEERLRFFVEEYARELGIKDQHSIEVAKSLALKFWRLRAHGVVTTVAYCAAYIVAKAIGVKPENVKRRCTKLLARLNRNIALVFEV
jgi:transcription initiation factor TFIIIB Brf1 subunit/transcription initiation factor TFIIB